jgi:hypothetical protein
VQGQDLVALAGGGLGQVLNLAQGTLYLVDLVGGEDAYE